MPSIYFTYSVLNPNTLGDDVVNGKWRSQVFHAVWCGLQVHSKENRDPVEYFFITNRTANKLGQVFDGQIQSILCQNGWHGTTYDVAKLRKIYLIAMLSTEDYIAFFADLLRTFRANDNNHQQLSDNSLPIEGSRMRDLPEKHAEAFREFFWYQHLFSDGFCDGPCRFRRDLTRAKKPEGSGKKLDLSIAYDEKDILAEMREVRDAALTLSLLSHSDCQQTEKVGFPPALFEMKYLWVMVTQL